MVILPASSRHQRDHGRARDFEQALLTGARAKVVYFPASLDEMRIYWRGIGGYRNASDLYHLFDALLATGLRVDGV